jgi:PKD domain
VLAAFMLPASPALAFVFNEPTVRQIAPETVPFDWSAQKCTNDDIPDQPARAFREANGTINFVDSHHTVWRSTTTNLTTLTHRCSPVVMNSHNNTDPAMYDDKEWIGATWTSDGTTVYGLTHSEYQGYRHAPGGYCIRSGESFDEKAKCWQNAITLVTSTNGGSTFSHTTPPSHLVAGSPTRWARGNGPIGFFQPSHIVKGQDGWHYVMARVMGGSQPLGSCVLRSRNISDPTSWRGWSGTGFTVTFPSPYLNTLDPAQHVCQPATPQYIGTLSESLGWSTYFKKWVLVGSSDNADAMSGPGFYFYTSDDLINWSQATLLMKAELPWTWQCSDGPQYYRDPSLLDPQSTTRNFDTMGQRPYLFFTRFNLSSCASSLDRDLIRIPIEFSNQAPGGPAATLSASNAAPRTGEAVTFDASGSRDEDGSITKFEWDLDGDGTYERDTGSSPVAGKTYSAADSVTVTVRVSDDDGKATDETMVVRIGGPGEAPRNAAGEPTPAAVGAVGRTSAPIGRLKLVRSRARRGGALVGVRVPAAGVLRVRAAGRAQPIRATRVHAGRAGVVQVVVKASPAGRAILARRGSMRVRAQLSFTPVGGVTQRLVRTLLVRE